MFAITLSDAASFENCGSNVDSAIENATRSVPPSRANAGTTAAATATPAAITTIRHSDAFGVRGSSRASDSMAAPTAAEPPCYKGSQHKRVIDPEGWPAQYSGAAPGAAAWIGRTMEMKRLSGGNLRAAGYDDKRRVL